MVWLLRILQSIGELPVNTLLTTQSTNKCNKSICHWCFFDRAETMDFITSYARNLSILETTSDNGDGLVTLSEKSRVYIKSSASNFVTKTLRKVRNRDETFTRPYRCSTSLRKSDAITSCSGKLCYIRKCRVGASHGQCYGRYLPG